MKYRYRLPYRRLKFVTSYTEVWIEISICCTNFSCLLVTSYTEVWIEIIFGKPSNVLTIVTSYTEVWIEIDISCMDFLRTHMSPPIRRCGLKFYRWCHRINCITSPPIRRCGLKLNLSGNLSKACKCHLLYGGVDWNSFSCLSLCFLTRHLLYGGVDWNLQQHIDCLFVNSHLLYGGVDWNIIRLDFVVLTIKSPPIRRCGLKFKSSLSISSALASPPIRRCGLK